MPLYDKQIIEIANLSKELADHEEQSLIREKEFSKELSRKDDLISQKDEEISRKDEEISRKDDVISQKDKIIEDLRKQLEEFKNQ